MYTQSDRTLLASVLVILGVASLSRFADPGNVATNQQTSECVRESVCGFREGAIGTDIMGSESFIFLF